MIQKTQEDYLRTIYSLYEKSKDKSRGIKSVEIAKSLKITKPTVSRIIKKLTKQKYLISEIYSKIYFTKKGLKEAKRIMHNHRVIEVFLKNILGCDIRRIHKEAHKLEHTFSEYTIRKLDKFLNNPKVSPMGEEIPHNKTKGGGKKWKK